ncbi:hypothetical protein LLE49_22755 [Alicyclobacillus tolerans]|uniref:hypothetical protein n=1 Tax=Alicyclobacillus tolerans TaxID=90970 RepID=UPI001F3F38FA|nr:hypothetical protein [Alicyclobacillus tolerans]MCF8567544.1 hypothetical protein [Alicyclobacillus tolerans]
MDRNFSTSRKAVRAEPWTVIRHAAVTGLTPRQLRLGRFGLVLFVISQAIPYFVLVNVRWMMAGSYIPPEMNPWTGLWPTLFLAVGILLAWLGVQANRTGNTSGLQLFFVPSVVLGIAAIVTLMIPLWVHPFDVLSHYGEIYVVCLGVAAFYTIIATIVVLGVVFRAGAGLAGPRISFGPESAAVVWTFNALAWFALYVDLYLI